MRAIRNIKFVTSYDSMTVMRLAREAEFTEETCQADSSLVKATHVHAKSTRKPGRKQPQIQ